MSEISSIAADLRSAAQAWDESGVEHRIEVLAQWAEVVGERRDDLVAALARDTGRVALSEMEVDWIRTSVARSATWARELIAGETERPSSDPGVTLTAASVPMGLVGVISPWNFPLQLALIDAVPALLMGCTVLVKPTEQCPEFVVPLRETVAAVPELAAVLHFVEGGPETGAEIVRSVDVVCFTGSVATGRKVAAAAAEAFVPAFLELGGKDAALVLPGADLDVAVEGVLWGGTANTGQSCMSLERVYVVRGQEEEFLARLAERAAQIGLVGVDEDGQLGPFIDPRQADVVARQLAAAVEAGARVVAGGQVEHHDVDGRGTRPFLRPTVVTDVDHTMDLMTEETFGPVLAVMVVEDTEEAVRLANDTVYGLSGAVFGPHDEAQAAATRLQAGGISVNDVCLTGMVPEGEKQAFRISGMGPSRMGRASLSRFRRQRVVLTRLAPQVQPWWYR
ncbi:aldehyde dehydrogenase family protein [Nocardioides yefusunii]|uniref:Aldehyde dehydrogenase family protein n=1 Tax=Nocardioides yefusunii TaxID=2500546 RepID=A0ABW1QVJ7_9ACTN|nr:aldehyde dehydrogenase family protein [Nocardioides yefusunii]